MRNSNDLNELVNVLTKLAQGNVGAWAMISGHRNVLRLALHNAVMDAKRGTTCFSRLDNELENCCTLLGDIKSQHAVQDCSEMAKEEVKHLLGNAQALVATEGAAISACYGSHNSAPERFVFWADRALKSLTYSSACQQSLDLSTVTITGYNRVQSGKKTVDYACKYLEQRGWSMAAPRCWIQYWLDDRSTQATTARLLTIPVGSYFNSQQGAFLMDLRLSLLNAAQGHLIEHPDMALLPMDEAFRSALVTGWKCGKRQSVCWSLTMRSTKLSSLPPLLGGSMGAAAATGFRLLHDKSGYDPGCIVLGRCCSDNENKPSLDFVDYEWEKLRAVTEWNSTHPEKCIRRAIVAKTT